jgi:thymidylate kinase
VEKESKEVVKVMEHGEPKFIVLEGADGTGKSTLANEILSQSKGHLIHGSWNKDWNIRQYHEDMYEAAMLLLPYQTVIMDRWATSEEVYAEAFRGGRQYDSEEHIAQMMGEVMFDDPTQTIYVYCENDNVVANHKENMKIRQELFEDMSPVVREYEKYLGRTSLNWLRYDFTKVNMEDFVKELLK